MKTRFLTNECVYLPSFGASKSTRFKLGIRSNNLKLHLHMSGSIFYNIFPSTTTYYSFTYLFAKQELSWALKFCRARLSTCVLPYLLVTGTRAY